VTSEAGTELEFEAHQSTIMLDMVGSDGSSSATPVAVPL
jgi:hypothetical protein